MLAPSQNPSTSGDDRNLVTIDENYLAPTFEDKVRLFWSRHAKTLIAILVIAAVALVARWALQLYAERRQEQIRQDYAAAATTEQLKAFVSANATSSLAGVAQLRLADEAYKAGNFSAAREAYQAAVPLLGTNLLAARARLGAAVSPLLAGELATAKPALEALANDLLFAKTLRSEAAYHLAVIARDGDQLTDAHRWVEAALTNDASSLWAQRAMQLRATLPPAPVPPAAAPVEAQATTSAPAAEASAVKVELPSSP